MNKDLRALLIEVADGSMDAFGEIYDSLAGRILNYARAITRNKDMAEDITHDVFMQIYDHAARIAQVSEPIAYIMTVTRNCSYNLLKRESHFSTVDCGDFDIETTDATYERLLLEDAFNTLPINQRETVYLHLICGYKHKDIAAIQNVPLVTVKWRYGKALSSLRDYLSEKESKEEKCNEHI